MPNNFKEGDVIYDVDGNDYTVRNCRAVRNVEGTNVAYFLGRSMAAHFSLENPKAKAA